MPLRHLIFACLLWAFVVSGCASTESPEVLSPPTSGPVSNSATPQPTPLPPRPESGVQADIVVEADLTDVRGTVNALAGLQGGPLPVVRGDGDLSEWYRRGGVDHVRLPQDTLPNNLTLGGIYPAVFAPTDAPRSYDFRRIDRYMEAIVASGATPLWQATYDLGQTDSLTDGFTGEHQGRFPFQREQWTGAIQGTLWHFNDGWADGHRWQVRYVEFLNEPMALGGCRNDSFGTAICWNLFKAFAEGIKAYNTEAGRDVQIVGPGNPVSVEGLEAHKEQLSVLLDTLEPDELDYLSFHPQGRTPLEQDAIAQELRRFLDSYADGEFGHVGLWASHWHSTAPGEDADAAQIAALDTATKILWQGTVDFATLYRADRWPQGPATAADIETGEVACEEFVTCVDSHYFTAQGDPTAAFLPFLALAETARATPERVAVENAAQTSVPVMVARSPDAEQLSVLLAAPNAASETYAVTLRGLPPGVRFEARRFVVDGVTEAWEPRETATVATAQDGSIRLNGQFFGPSVVYWQLKTQ